MYVYISTDVDVYIYIYIYMIYICTYTCTYIYIRYSVFTASAYGSTSSPVNACRLREHGQRAAYLGTIVILPKEP